MARVALFFPRPGPVDGDLSDLCQKLPEGLTGWAGARQVQEPSCKACQEANSDAVLPVSTVSAQNIRQGDRHQACKYVV